MDLLRWLEGWYESNCNGDWEHCYQNVTIQSLDNPGWSIEVNLMDTSLENKKFERIKIDNSENDWFSCFVEKGKFKGYGDTEKLSVMIQIFKDWAENGPVSCN